ncbi:hypothetical protein Q7P37_008884 [Cladosporium fusiforme]
MSFDRYFKNAGQEWLSDDSDNDWYGIVEDALYAANLQPRREKGQLEINLMKPLPVIPEDAVVDSPIVALVEDVTPRRPSSVYSSETNFSHWPNPHATQIHLPKSQEEHTLQIEHEDAIARRPSSVYSTDFDSPQSPESDALDYWVNDICMVHDSTMGALREKPFERPSLEYRSSSSDWSASMGSSDMERRSRSSSIYSVDSSVYSYNSYVKSACVHTRNVSGVSTVSSKKVRFEETAMLSFFEISDSEEEGEDGEREESVGNTTARPKSHASKCLRAGRQLGKKALSLRITTSPKTSESHKKASSMPSSEVPSLSAWLFRSSLLDRISTSPKFPGEGLEGELMAGAAESAKARRVLGLR